MTRPVLLILLSTAVHLHAGLSRIAALGMIESGNNDSAVGAAGEISRYQIQPWIWRRYSDSVDYRNHRVAARVAQQHLESLERIFARCARRGLSDFDLYVLWNAGPTYYARAGWTPGRIDPVIRERAKRYSNLCAQAEVKAAPPPSLAASALPRPVSGTGPSPGRPPVRALAIPATVSGSPGSLVITHNSVFAIAGSR